LSLWVLSRSLELPTRHSREGGNPRKPAAILDSRLRGNDARVIRSYAWSLNIEYRTNPAPSGIEPNK
jgi:hypothetical protein